MTSARQPQRSAVVVMAKAPVPGRTKTRLCPPLSPSQAAALSEAMLHDTIAIVSGVRGITLAVALTPGASLPGLRPAMPPGAVLIPVDGTDIGDCLGQVIALLFAQGFDAVMALNSDGPTLPPAHVEWAQKLLEDRDVVIGPGEDGGYYLVGLTSPSPGLFRGIDWSTGQVMAQTLARASDLGLSVGLLPPWYDVDTGVDLARLRRELDDLPPHVAERTRRFFNGWHGPAAPTGRPASEFPQGSPVEEHRP